MAFLAFALVVTVIYSTFCQAKHGPRVQTEMGVVEGFTRRALSLTEQSVDVFWGIPYAAPPVGPNRLRPPQPFDEPWEGVRPAKRVPHLCPQFNLVGKTFLGKEDCLYLNVYRPHGATANAKLPVLVWLYGGGFALGDGYEFSFYDGTHVVKRHGHVIVTLNYRLSGLGFFALPELLEADGTTGNYGVQDQRAGMQWVQRNIRSFGGDPGQVTIAGESAGGMSVMFHLASPGSAGLFHAAIMESGSSHANWWFQNLSQAFEMYGELAGILGCPDAAARLDCLRSLPEHDFMQSAAQLAKYILAERVHSRMPIFPLPKDIPDFASPMYPIMHNTPVVDGTLTGLPGVPLTLVKRGEFNKVPLIVGSNKDGGAYFAPFSPLLYGSSSYDLEAFAQRILPDQVDQQKFVHLYTSADYPNHRLALDRAFRDMVFMCESRELAIEWSRAGLPTYLYVFSFNFTGTAEALLGDAHAFELPFVFRNYFEVMEHFSKAGGDSYERMADVMSCLWASFVRCSAPKCDDARKVPPHCDYVLNSLPDWPHFGVNATEGRQYYSLRADPVIQKILPHAEFRKTDEFPGDDKCDFWRDANYGFVHLRNYHQPQLFV
jgi:carboxylesterase type B